MRDYSFIIVSWNAQAYLRQCLDSIKTESKGLDVEVIVVDNASSDGSPEMVQAEYPWVVLIRNDANVGFARANNQGIAISSATYLCLLNSDVVIHPGCLVQMRDFLDANPQIGLAGPKVLNSDGTLQSSCRKAPTLRSVLFRALALDTLFSRSSTFGAHFMTNWDHDDVRVVDILSGCCWFARPAGGPGGRRVERGILHVRRGHGVVPSIRLQRLVCSVQPGRHDHALRRSQLLQAADPLLHRNAAGGSPVLAHASRSSGLHHLLRCGCTGTCLSGCRSLCSLARPAFGARAVRSQSGRQCRLFGAFAHATTDGCLTSPTIRPSERQRTGMTKAEPHYSLVTAFRNEKNWLADLCARSRRNPSSQPRGSWWTTAPRTIHWITPGV